MPLVGVVVNFQNFEPIWRYTRPLISILLKCLAVYTPADFQNNESIWHYVGQLISEILKLFWRLAGVLILKIMRMFGLIHAA